MVLVIIYYSRYTQRELVDLKEKFKNPLKEKGDD